MVFVNIASKIDSRQMRRFELKYIEEPELERRMGEPYIQYKKLVPMFFPKFRPKKE